MRRGLHHTKSGDDCQRPYQHKEAPRSVLVEVGTGVCHQALDQGEMPARLYAGFLGPDRFTAYAPGTSSRPVVGKRSYWHAVGPATRLSIEP